MFNYANSIKQATATQQKPVYDNWGSLAQQQQSILQNQSAVSATALKKWQSMASSGNANTITNALGQKLQNTFSQQADSTLKLKNFFNPSPIPK